MEKRVREEERKEKRARTGDWKDVVTRATGREGEGVALRLPHAKRSREGTAGYGQRDIAVRCGKSSFGVVMGSTASVRGERRVGKQSTQTGNCAAQSEGRLLLLLYFGSRNDWNMLAY